MTPNIHELAGYGSTEIQALASLNDGLLFHFNIRLQKSNNPRSYTFVIHENEQWYAYVEKQNFIYIAYLYR